MVKRIAVYHSLDFGGALNMVGKFSSYLGESAIVDLYCIRPAAEGRPHPVFVGVRRIREFKIRLLGNAPNLIKNLFPVLDLVKLHFLSQSIAREIDSERYDVVLVFACRYTQSPLVLKYLKTPIAFYCSEPFRFFYEPKTPPNRAVALKKRIGFLLLSPWHAIVRKVEARLPARAGVVFTHSEYTRSQINAIYGVDARICPLGIEPRFLEDAPEVEKENVVISVGAVVWKKGHDFAVRAVGKISPLQRPQLKIFGHWAEQDEPGYLRDLAVRCGVDLELSIGSVSDKQMVNEYRKASVVLCMAYNEPFGLTPLEAFACGIPVVAIKEGGYLETVIDGENGFLVERNIDDIALAVAKLINDKELAAAFGRNGQARTRREWTGSTTEVRLREIVEIAASFEAKRKNDNGSH